MHLSLTAASAAFAAALTLLAPAAGPKASASAPASASASVSDVSVSDAPVSDASVSDVSNASAPSGCPEAEGRVVCISLTQQKLWLTRDGERVWGPAPIRSGRPALPTRTGWHRITRRVEDDRSRLYDAPMPYAQYFNGGQAVHGVHGYVHTGKGSHGCVNLMHDDARALWKRTRTGDRVYVWGARPARLK